MWNGVLPRSLLGRALLIAVTPLIFVQVLSAYLFYESHWDQVSKRLSLGLAGDIAVLVDALAGLPDEAVRRWLFEEATRKMDVKASIERNEILPNAPARETAVEGELRRALVYKGITKPVRVDEQTRKDQVVVLV